MKQGIRKLPIVIMKKTMRCDREQWRGALGESLGGGSEAAFEPEDQDRVLQAPGPNTCAGAGGEQKCRWLSLDPRLHPEHCTIGRFVEPAVL